MEKKNSDFHKLLFCASWREINEVIQNVNMKTEKDMIDNVLF